MKMNFGRFTRSSVSAVVLCAGAIWATMTVAIALDKGQAWTIDAAASSLTFNTTKSGTAGVGGVLETMQFKRFSGCLDHDGRIQLKIDLSSVDSGIAIRDERMQSMLWNVQQYPVAIFSAQLKPEDVARLAQEPIVLPVDGQLTLAGQSKPVKAQLQVTPMTGDTLLVSARQPVLVKSEEFGLKDGVEALRAVMGLNYLSSSAPVTFHLVLHKAGARSH